MKKINIFFVALAVALMLIGGIGAGYYFTTARTFSEEVTTHNLQPASTNKKLIIQSDMPINQMSIRETKDTQFSAKHTKNFNEFKNFNWQIRTEKGSDVLILKWDNNDQFDISGIQYLFNPLSQLKISVPVQYDEIIIENKQGNISLNHLTLDQLSVHNTGGACSLNQIKADKLSVSTTYGQISLDEQVTANTCQIKTKGGNITAHSNEQANKFTDLTIEAESSEISLNDIKLADTVSITQKSGNIYLQDIDAADKIKLRTSHATLHLAYVRGPLDVISSRGDVILSSDKLSDPLTIRTRVGNIRIHYSAAMPKDYTIDATTKGTVELFGKKEKHLTDGTNKVPISLISESGNITVAYDEGSDDDGSWTDDEADEEWLDDLEDSGTMRSQ